MAVLVAAAAVELVDYTFGLACRIFPEISPIIKFFWLNSLIAFTFKYSRKVSSVIYVRFPLRYLYASDSHFTTFTNASIFALFVVTVAFTLPSAFLTTIGALIYAWFIWVCISIITFYWVCFTVILSWIATFVA
jgi:hypothetical protein